MAKTINTTTYQLRGASLKVMFRRLYELADNKLVIVTYMHFMG